MLEEEENRPGGRFDLFIYFPYSVREAQWRLIPTSKQYRKDSIVNCVMLKSLTVRVKSISQRARVHLV